MRRRGDIGRRGRNQLLLGGSPPAPTPNAYVMSGFNNAGNEYYSGANNGAPLGGTSMSVGMICRITGVPAGTQSPWSHAGAITGPTAGWVVWSSGASLRFSACQAAGTFVTSPTRNWVVGDVGSLHAIVGTYDGATVRMYFNKAQVGAGTAGTGYATPSATLRTAIGAGDNNGTDSFAATSYEIMGVFFTDAVMSLAEIQAWSDASKAANDVALPGVGSNPLRWRTSDVRALPATWDDTVVPVTLDRRGAVVSLAVTNLGASPTWGF